MRARCRPTSEYSRFIVQPFATGHVSFLGHSPTFTVGDFARVVEFPGDLVANLRLELTVAAGGLAVAA